MSAEVAMERAERGAALLDEKRPGWEHRIDLAELDLMSSCRCVLGQLFRTDSEDEEAYAVGVRAFSLEFVPGFDSSASHFGFNTHHTNPVVTYEELDEAWIHIIKRRHDLGVFSDSE